MDKKLTLPDLVADISTRTGIPKLKVEEFLKEFIAMVSETLADGESVRIKGIGTFKVSEVEARRSVHVATGEKIVIQSHRKVSFSPSGDLAEAVNEPFAFFEAVELADGVSEEMLAEAEESDKEIDISDVDERVAEEYDFADYTLDPEEEAQAGEEFVADFAEESESEASESEKSVSVETIVDVPFEFAGDDAPAANPEEASKPAKPETSAEASAPEVKDGNTLQEESASADSSDISVSTPDPYYEAVEEEFSQPVAEKENHRHRSGFNAGLLIGILGATCAIFLAMAIWRAVGPESYSRLVGIVSQQPEMTDDIQEELNLTGFDDSITPEQEESDIEEAEAIEPDTEVSDAARLAQIEAEKKAVEEKKKEEARLLSEKQAKEKAEKAEKEKRAKEEKEKKNAPVYDTISRTRYLTTMAKEHYGNYHLWPYIYEENKAILGHPDRIRPGTKVMIPPLSKYGVNPGNAADIAEAKRKGAAIYSRYK